jgi:hypothetical protein
MTNKRNYREEIELALAGERPAHVPFSIYNILVPQGINAAPLQAKGLSILSGRGVYKVETPNVKVKRITEADGSVITVYETPLGNLTSLFRVGGYGALCPVEYPIKKRDDYAIAAFIANDRRYEPAFDGFLAEKARMGDAGIVIPILDYSPLLEIQIRWVGQEQFCYDIIDNEDAVMDLYESLLNKNREAFAVFARGPAQYCHYCGNLVPEMIGLERVRDYVFPCYNAFADLLHEHGKKLGVHLDANNRLIMDLVKESSIDFVEAFTPPPVCNVSVAEARQAWPEKQLWINFPSSVHIASEEEIRNTTLEILEQAGDRKGFLMGVTEDIPIEHLERSISTILDTLNEFCA